jgi:predicted acyltransferase
MSVLQSVSPVETPVRVAPPRVLSIDIFRGITLAVMIFVNALSEVKGLPWWTYHAHAQEDRMTYVDMVFPFFLFIVGMAMPLAIRQRLKRSASMPALWGHILLRVLGLLVLGLILANADRVDTLRTGMSGSAWGLLGLVSAALYLNVYPKSMRFPRYPLLLRTVGVAGVVLAFTIFRSTTADGRAAWIDFSYPEILGLIALSYLAAAILYVPTRDWKLAPFGWFVALAGLNCLSSAHLLLFPTRLPLYIWPFGNGAMVSIIMAGVVTSGIFLGKEVRPAPGGAMLRAILFSALTLVAGFVLTPLGISKIRATPTWSLYSIGAAILVFTLLYWICDVRKQSRWAFPFQQAGSNGLMTYLLPDLWYFMTAAVGFTYIDTHWASGWEAVVKTVLFTVFILVLAFVCTKGKIRLAL